MNRLFSKMSLLIGIFSCFTFVTQSQVSLAHDTVVSTVIVDLFETVGENDVLHDVTTERTYEWVRHEVEMKDGWETEICDRNACYFAHIGTRKFKLDPHPDSIGRLDVHLKPNGDYVGYALVELVVTDVNMPSSSITAVYIFDSSLSGTTYTQSTQFKVFPNPSQGMFSIVNDDMSARFLEVYSLSGTLMKRLEFGQQEVHEISDLMRGTYLLHVLDENESLLGSKLISKL